MAAVARKCSLKYLASCGRRNPVPPATEAQTKRLYSLYVLVNIDPDKQCHRSICLFHGLFQNFSSTPVSCPRDIAELPETPERHTYRLLIARLANQLVRVTSRRQVIGDVAAEVNTLTVSGGLKFRRSPVRPGVYRQQCSRSPGWQQRRSGRRCWVAFLSVPCRMTAGRSSGYPARWVAANEPAHGEPGATVD